MDCVHSERKHQHGQGLKYIERDFRHIKADDLDLRPVFHLTRNQVRFGSWEITGHHNLVMSGTARRVRQPRRVG
jgi:hypothetical protein